MMPDRNAQSINGFSLLEVILATAIIASSAMVLLRLISTGEQHQSRAERKAIGQMICQSLVERMLIDSSLIEDVDDRPVEDNPAWTYTTKREFTEFPGVVRVRIRAAKTAVTAVGEPIERTAGDRKFDFELVRWLRLEPESSDAALPWEDAP